MAGTAALAKGFGERLTESNYSLAADGARASRKRTRRVPEKLGKLHSRATDEATALGAGVSFCKTFRA